MHFTDVPGGWDMPIKKATYRALTAGEGREGLARPLLKRSRHGARIQFATQSRVSNETRRHSARYLARH